MAPTPMLRTRDAGNCARWKSDKAAATPWEFKNTIKIVQVFSVLRRGPN